VKNPRIRTQPVEKPRGTPRRLLVAFSSFTAAQLAGAAVFDLVDGAERLAIGTLPVAWLIVPWLPILLVPIWAGWRALSLGELVLLGPCGALSYLAFLALSGQLPTEPDPMHANALEHTLVDVVLLASGALLLGAVGWAVHWIWLRRAAWRADDYR
jgi:hypothetical protein